MVSATWHANRLLTEEQELEVRLEGVDEAVSVEDEGELWPLLPRPAALLQAPLAECPHAVQARWPLTFQHAQKSCGGYETTFDGYGFATRHPVVLCASTCYSHVVR